MTLHNASRERVAFNSDLYRDENGKLRVLLVYKKSRLESFGPAPKTADYKDLQDEHDQHQQCLEIVRQTLSQSQVAFEDCYRGELSQGKTENRIVVTVGGDGTILDASHFSLNNPILGINSDPSRSVGSLCLANEKTFAAIFAQLENGTLKVLPIARIGGTLDGKELPVIPLNDILVAHPNPAAMSRYKIAINGKEESHRSSGVWIAGPMGSTGATLSAGGRVCPLNDKRIQIIVREPYFSPGKVTSLLSGMLKEEHVLTLTSQMRDGQIFFDGPHKMQKFGIGSVLELNSRGPPLFLFINDDMEIRRTQLASLRESYHEQMMHNEQEFISIDN